MDPNRHHEFIASNEERTRGIYYNRSMEDVRSHTQYYAQERISNNKKICGCANMAGSVMCNGCQTNSSSSGNVSVGGGVAKEENWNVGPSHGSDFRNTDTRHTFKQNQMYIPANTSNRPYWQHGGNSSFPKEPMISSKTLNLPSVDRNVSNKNCTLDNSYNYKPPPTHQRISSIGTYCKDRAAYDTVVNTKVGYAPVPPSGGTAMYNIDSRNHHHTNTNLEALRNTKIDQHVINPSNIIGPKEQHPSPNYARKCPQIFPQGEQNSGAHLNLYMSAPQFSSDKFTNIHTHQKLSRESTPQEYRGDLNSSSTHTNAHMHSDTQKMHEIPSMQMTSSLSAYSSPQNKYHPTMNEPIQTHVMQQQPLHQHQHQLHHQLQQSSYANSSSNMQSRNVSYYPQGPAKVHAPEMSPIIMKQTHTHYQYSESPVPPSPSHLVTAKTTPREIVVNYVKKEDDSYDSHGIPNRSLYVNPYNTPPSSDSCCKDSSPYAVPSNYRDESPQGYSKYGKVVQETMTTNKLSMLNQNTPPTNSNRPPRFKDQIYYYDGNSHCLTSPAAATVASPSPSLSTSQSQIHHSDYTSQIHHTPASAPAAYHQDQLLHQHQSQHQADIRQPSIRGQDLAAHPSSADAFERQMQKSSAAPPCSTVINKVQLMNVQSVQAAQASKKSQMPKPNYRELINQAYAIRNATSEEELNMQIIKKTLNVDAQVIRTSGAGPPVIGNNSIVASLPIETPQRSISAQSSSRMDSSMSHSISPAQINTVRGEAYRSSVDIMSAPLLPLSKTTMEVIVPDIKQHIKQEEKTSFYPLDLSMRTVKTKADSTEYKYGCMQQGNTDCKSSTLPRVDFTPNFSLHTKDNNTTERNIINKSSVHPVSKLMQCERVFFKSTDLNHIPTMATTASMSAITTKPEHSQSTKKINFSSNYELKSQPIVNVQSHNTSATLIRNEVLAVPPNSVLIKNSVPKVVHQVRPTVLETNPYAAAKVHLTDKNQMAVEKLPPETSIMPLPKSNFVVAASAQSSALLVKKTDTNTKQSAYSLACERNPNFLGRKRHLQEYSSSKYNEPLSKQARPQETLIKSENIRSAEVTVIAINERAAEMERIRTAEKLTNAETPSSYKQSYSTCNMELTEHVKVCKTEPLTPTMNTPTPPPLPLPLPLPPMTNPPIKSETNSLIAARIRTKAELKGFTFNPPPINEKTLPKESLKIKEEPQSLLPQPQQPQQQQSQLQKTTIELPSIPGLNDDYNQGKLLDFSWSNTCNSLVEQLLTNSKKKLSKKTPDNNNKHDLTEDDLPAATIVKEDSTVVSTVVQQHKEDSISINNSLIDNISNMESAETNSISCSRIGENESTMTKTIAEDTSYSQNATQKKISKVDREKLRLQQEKRIAARLQSESSSESDNEMDKRKTERLKKPLKRGRPRLTTFSGRNKCSDCGSDSSTDSDKDAVLAKTKAQGKAHESNEQITKQTKEEKSNSKERSKVESSATENRRLSKTGGDCIKINNNKPEEELHSNEGSKEKQKDKYNKVQYMDEKNKSKFEKPISSQMKTNSKVVDLNTMTRSKRKKELELQLANSKVLRNDKIIRNSTTKIKRKYVRKFVNNQNSSSKDSLLKKECSEMMSTRLRSKNELNAVNKRKNLFSSIKKNVNVKNNKSSTPSLKDKEPQRDLFLEVYRYKRSLKVPPSLITIKHPSNHKTAASLPDLERDADEMSSFSKHRKNKSNKTSVSFLKSKGAILPKTHNIARSQIAQKLPPEEPKSIIDLLHSRVTNSSTSTVKAPKAKILKINCNTNLSVNAHSENSQNTESNSISELLPSLKKTEDEDESLEGKKRHFSIFETKVLQTKTRTESKLQQKREIIREIFVGDDRPASAPPEMTQSSNGVEKMTYEQKYEQFLQQMNVVISEDKLGKFGRARTSIVSSLSAALTPELKIKQEDDTESASAIDIDEKLDGETQHDNLSNNSGILHSGFRRRRPGKYFRRKGSSGFDYIRKKKKPTAVTSSHSLHAHAVLKLEKLEDFDEFKIKTEKDVCREIQKWVLNKGVGQSTMHKAARLGYIDVIVYCLDRMGMNPDQKDNAGYTPLHEACTNGWLEIARVLLQYGANHSEAAHSGIRPLHEASENDHEEIVRLLLSYGADPLLATYSGQTPLMLASSSAMRNILNNHLSDVQNVGPDRKPWRFNGPWQIFDAAECGYDIFGGAPNFTCDMSRALRKSSCSSLITNKKHFNQYGETSSKTVMDECAVVLDNIDRFNSVRLYNDNKPEFLVENSDSEGEIFEFEEADVLLPPLYLLKDEGADKWVLLSDLCNLLKVKSKDTLLNKIYPSSSVSSGHKSLMRELKMSDFLERATCLQLLCAGEKINICASKVVLIKYNERVRNLLGVKTILMKF